MSWTWRYETADGRPVNHPALPRDSFPSQADAETWLGEEWRGLLERGVAQVSLLEDGRAVYAGMSLLPAD